MSGDSLIQIPLLSQKYCTSPARFGASKHDGLYEQCVSVREQQQLRLRRHPSVPPPVVPAQKCRFTRYFDSSKVPFSALWQCNALVLERSALGSGLFPVGLHSDADMLTCCCFQLAAHQNIPLRSFFCFLFTRVYSGYITLSRSRCCDSVACCAEKKQHNVKVIGAV